MLSTATPARAGVLDASWTAPTTNVDGSALTDLASYKVYYGPTNPPCPGSTFISVASPTATPGPGQTVTGTLTGLATGTQYFAAVTAVDTGGSESACSTVTSAVARTDFTVSPTGTVDFGSVNIGSVANQTFTVQNTGGGTVSGTVTTSAPFSVVSGASFNLVGAGSTATGTVRFAPVVAAIASTNVTFTANGGSVSRGVTGTGLATNPAPTLTSVSPTSATAGGAALTLTVNGSNFVSGSSVRWNGAARTTTFVSATRLTAAVTAADLATAGTASVTVFSPTPGGGTSSALVFTIDSSTPPGAATLLAPSGSIATGTPTFTWNAVAGATAYLLWVDDSSGGRIRTTYTAAQVGCATGTGTCSIASSAVLTPGAGQWWIVTSNAAGSGPWSSAMTYTVAGTPPPPPATLVAPSGSTATKTPTFTWNAVASATAYLLWVDDSSGGRIRTTYTAAQVGCATGTGTCSIASSAVLTPGAGQWWIVTSNAAGSGPWSSAMAYTVVGTPPPPPATLVAPSGSIASKTPTFTWNAVASATAYLLWVDDSSGGRIRTTYTAAQVGCATGTGTCSIASSAVLTPGAGQWWIVTSNAAGSGPWSSGMTFTAP